MYNLLQQRSQQETLSKRIHDRKSGVRNQDNTLCAKQRWVVCVYECPLVPAGYTSSADSVYIMIFYWALFFNFRFFNFLTFLANKNGAPITSANPASSAPSNPVPVQQPPVTAQITPAPKRPVPIASAPSRPALIAPAPSRPALIPPSAPRLKQSLLVPMIRTDLASSSVVRTVIPTPPHLGENSRKPIVSLNHLIS